MKKFDKKQKTNVKTSYCISYFSSKLLLKIKKIDTNWLTKARSFPEQMSTADL